MKTCILTCAFLCIMLFSKAQNISNLPTLKLAPFANGFKYPIDMANCGDSRLFIVERLGKIWVTDSTGKKIGDKTCHAPREDDAHQEEAKDILSGIRTRQHLTE